MANSSEFFNLYRHGFARVAVAVPVVRVADPMHNAAQTVALLKKAAARHAVLAVFPELGLSAYSCEDLFHQQALLDAVLRALGQIAEASRRLPVVAVVGVPLKVDHCSSTAPRWSTGGASSASRPRPICRTTASSTSCASSRPPMRHAARRDRRARADARPSATGCFSRPRTSRCSRSIAEICEDLWVPVPPSSYAALAGATVVANLSASNITVGKDEYRRTARGEPVGALPRGVPVQRGGAG